MSLFISTFLLVSAGLFPIVNPIGGAPLFLGLTDEFTEKQRNTLAMSIALNSFFLLLGSLFIGSYVLEFFGISLPVLRIGGGLVVTSFGWKLLNSGIPAEDHRTAMSAVSAIPDSFYPLTMPLTVGPGSISVAITLGSQRWRDQCRGPAVRIHSPLHRNSDYLEWMEQPHHGRELIWSCSESARDGSVGF